MSEIKREDDGGAGRYVVQEDGQEAEMTYTMLPDGTMRIDHTGVPDAMGGRGIGASLVARAVDDARKGGFKIKPVCSYAAAQFGKHPEWADLKA